MNLKKDLLKVSISNIVVLFASLVNSFLLPNFLSIKGYADFRTYILYSSFIGVLHFGFVDGINLKYGGQNIKNVDFQKFEKQHIFFIVFQVTIFFLILILNLLLKSEVILFLSFAIVPINLQSFFLFFYQAIGEFKLYTISIVIVPVLTIFLSILFIILKVQKYEIFVIINIVSYYIAVIYIEYKHFKSIRYPLIPKSKVLTLLDTLKNFEFNFQSISPKQFKKIFISGFFITIATLAFNFFFNTGQWVTKIFTTDELFATYALSVSLIGFVIIFVTALNKTFYPYLHRYNEKDVIIRLRQVLLAISTLAIPFFFLLKFVILAFLKKYEFALPITAILITSIPGIFIIKSIYANLYKIERVESKFLIDTILYLLIGAILVSFSFFVFKTLESIAISSVIIIYLWTLFPIRFNLYSNKLKIIEIIHLALCIGSFYLIYLFDLNIFLSFFVSIFINLLLNFIFYRKTILYFLK